MSYSINFKSTNKAVAKTDAEAAFKDQVAKQQPIHELDQSAALANVGAAIDLMPEGKPLTVMMNGSIWTNTDGVAGVSIGCSVGVDTTVNQ